VSSARTPMGKSAENRPPARAAAREKIYLYAIVAAGEDRVYEAAGINQRRVYALATGQIAAVVSDVAGENVRPERARLAAHHEVLKKLMAETTPLPMSFGIVADSPAVVRRMLARNQEVLRDQLQHVAGKVEMGLRVTWDVENIFEYFVNVHPELRIARDRLLGSNCPPTQEQKIEVGRMFDRLLNDDREAHADLAMGIFASHECEIKRLKCRNEREVMNLACLVKREAVPQFEAGVFEIAKEFDNNFALDYNGPWAPHNFVTVDLEL
jgi:Gas vesicle synthesis protein GvpL/GvpF